MFRKTVLYAMIVMIPVLLSLGCSDDRSSSRSTDFTGKWRGSAQETGSPNPTMELEISEQDGQVTGRLSTLDGTFVSAEVADARIVEAQLLFRAIANGNTQFKGNLYLFALERSGNQITGTWTDVLQGAEGPLTLTPDEG